MSQVVVTKDSYAKAREISRQQERAIDVEQCAARWRRTDRFEPKMLWILGLAGGVAAMVLFGSLILACSMFAFAVTLGLARLWCFHSNSTSPESVFKTKRSSQAQN